jgi:hypothetical protein
VTRIKRVAAVLALLTGGCRMPALTSQFEPDSQCEMVMSVLHARGEGYTTVPDIAGSCGKRPVPVIVINRHEGSQVVWGGARQRACRDWEFYVVGPSEIKGLDEALLLELDVLDGGVAFWASLVPIERDAGEVIPRGVVLCGIAEGILKRSGGSWVVEWSEH